MSANHFQSTFYAPQIFVFIHPKRRFWKDWQKDEIRIFEALLRGVSNIFGRRTIEKYIENLDFIVCQFFQNLRLGSIRIGEHTFATTGCHCHVSDPVTFLKPSLDGWWLKGVHASRVKGRACESNMAMCHSNSHEVKMIEWRCACRTPAVMQPLMLSSCMSLPC